MNTLLLQPEEAAKAAELLRSGALAAIPTETVYGLGANALCEEAVAKIFAVKGRPQDNPLIVHIASPEDLDRWCRDIPEEAWLLARRFWPGPLTMVLPRQDCVPLRVTAGLETVAVRCPDHALTREIIARAGVPVAAPSANLSGKPSPTTARHCVEDLWGKVEAIVDGGACRVGVESTIVDMSCRPFRVLRPGGVTLEQLREVLGEVELDPGLVKEGETPRAPGMKYRHYAPQAPLTLLKSEERQKIYDYVNQMPDEGTAVLCFDGEEGRFPGKRVMSYGREDAPETLAAAVFACLRALDSPETARICALYPPEGGMGLAVVNRLKKAAGGNVLCL